MREARCPSCGAPLRPGAMSGTSATCTFCGANLVMGHGGPPAGKRATAIVLSAVGEPRIEIIKRLRGFSGLGLAEVHRALERLPATFSIREPNVVPETVIAELTALGCVGSIAIEAAVLATDPVFAGHVGEWGFRIESRGDTSIEAIKLVREVADLGLAEAKAAIETKGALVPIATRTSHEEIRRRFAALGYVVSFAPSGG